MLVQVLVPSTAYGHIDQHDAGTVPRAPGVEHSPDLDSTLAYVLGEFMDGTARVVCRQCVLTDEERQALDLYDASLRESGRLLDVVDDYREEQGLPLLPREYPAPHRKPGWPGRDEDVAGDAGAVLAALLTGTYRRHVWSPEQHERMGATSATAALLVDAIVRLCTPPAGAGERDWSNPVGDRRIVDVGDLLGSVLSRAAARLGGPEALVAGRPGSWEAEHVRNLAGGWEGYLPPEPPATEPVVEP